MRTPKLAHLMRATNRNLFLPVVVLIAAVLLIGGGMRSYLSSLLQGPRTVSSADLDKITDVYDLNPDYLRIRGLQNFDIGSLGVQQGFFGRTTHAGYLRLVKLNRQYVVIQTARANDTRLEYSGILEVLPRDVKLGVSDDLYRTNPQATLYPFMLHADTSPQPWVGIGILVLALVMLWYVAQWARRNADLMNHPLVKQLAPYGLFEQNEASLNEDLERPDSIRLGRTRLLQTWLLQAHLFSIRAVPLGDVSWIYARVHQHRWHGIPISKSYTAVIHADQQPAVEVSLVGKRAGQFLQELQARVPWSVFGFSEDLETLWEDDRATFRARVQERKAQLRGRQTQPLESSA